MRVRRSTGLLGIALALTLALAACGGDDEGGDGGPANEGASFAEGTTMARLKEAGTVTVGTKFDQPLFGLKNLEGKPEGFDVEIAKLIAGEMGIAADKVNFIESVSANREPFIQQDKVDFVVATYTINDKRKEVVDFAGPVLCGRPGHHGRQGQPRGHRRPRRPGRQEGLLGDRLDPGREHPHQLPRRRADRVRRLLQVRRGPQERPGPGRHHRQRHPARA